MELKKVKTEIVEKITGLTAKQTDLDTVWANLAKFGYVPKSNLIDLKLVGVQPEPISEIELKLYLKQLLEFQKNLNKINCKPSQALIRCEVWKIE